MTSPEPVLAGKKIKPPSTFITGHCNNGCCEGTNKLSPRGALMPTCRGRYEWRGKVFQCTHECHALFAQMRALMEEVNNTDSSSAHAVEWPSFTPAPMPASMTVETPTFASDPLTAPIRVFSTARTEPAASPVVLTPSGRRAKGVLEEQVRAYLAQVCAAAAGNALVQAYGVSPGVISKAIDPENPPSQGAVYAVLLGWSKKNLVNLETKPFRFMGFTPQGERQLKF